MPKDEIVFTDGLSVRKVSDTLFGISINVEKFADFMSAYKTARGYVNINIQKSKEKDSWYGMLNTWQPDNQKQIKPKEEIIDDEIPF